MSTPDQHIKSKISIGYIPSNIERSRIFYSLFEPMTANIWIINNAITPNNDMWLPFIVIHPDLLTTSQP